MPMSVAAMAAALPMRAGSQSRPIIGAKEGDLFMSTVDAKGRLALRGPASTMGWTTGQLLSLTRGDGALHLSGAPDPTHIRACVLDLDSRCRVLLPYFIRIQHNWEPGIRLIVLAVPDENVLVTIPVSRVVAALLGNP
jgi:hypothetical protein